MLNWFRKDREANRGKANTAPGVAEPSRRRFFRAAGAGALAGGATLAAGGTANAADEIRSPSSYKETEHMKRYYDSARM